MAYNYTDVVFTLKGLTPTDKLVLLHLAEHADKDTGECWPGYGRLASFTGLTRRQVIYSVRHLVELELITVAEDSPRNTNTYTLHMHKLVAASTAPVEKRAKRKYTKSEVWRQRKHTGSKAKADDITTDEPDIEAELTDIRNWSEPRLGRSGERLRNCIIYQLDHAKDGYIRDSGITLDSMRHVKFINLLDEKTPLGWTPENMGKVKKVHPPSIWTCEDAV